MANGTTFTFSDNIGFGTYMQVTFSDNQITLTNLIPGICPEYTAADFAFPSGPALTGVSIDPSSSPLFAPGSILSANSYAIHLNLSNTCTLCAGGESIILNAPPRCRSRQRWHCSARACSAWPCAAGK